MTRQSVRRNDVATQRRAEELRHEDTQVAEAIGLILQRLAFLSSDEFYGREGKPGGPGTLRIPAEYRMAYEAHLKDALALLVEAEDVYVRQRANIRAQRSPEAALEDLLPEGYKIDYTLKKKLLR